MTVHRLLFGLFVVALLSVLLIGVVDRNDDSRTASLTTTSDSTPFAGATAGPQPAAAVHERDLASQIDLVERAVSADPTDLFYSCLAAIRSEGEVAAQQRLTSDIERLIRQRPELACE
jgi:hypothetical protein